MRLLETGVMHDARIPLRLVNYFTTEHECRQARQRGLQHCEADANLTHPSPPDSMIYHQPVN